MPPGVHWLGADGPFCTEPAGDCGQQHCRANATATVQPRAGHHLVSWIMGTEFVFLLCIISLYHDLGIDFHILGIDFHILYTHAPP